MSEIKLSMRYPESRLEDITDAYMRGFEVGLAMRTDENAKLRELVADLWEYIHIGTAQDGQSLHDRTRELGVEV